MTTAGKYTILRSYQQQDVVFSVADVLDKLATDSGRDELRRALMQLLAADANEIRPGNLITSAWASAIQGRLARLESLLGAEEAVGRSYEALAGAWAVFRGLSANGSFCPGATTPEAALATIRIKQYLDNVALVALVGSMASLSSKALDSTKVFEQLYQVQHELVLAFLSPLQGVSDSSAHRLFANAILPLLDQTGPPGLTPLKTAIDNGDLDGAIAAQSRINGFASNFGGDVVSGNLNVVYRGSGPEGETLVVGETKAFTFKFDIENRTNRQLDVQLKAEFLPPHDDWTQHVSIINSAGNAISKITLEKFNATSTSGWSQQIRAAITTPTGAASGADAGAKGTLRLIASTSTPVILSHFDQHDISITSAVTPTLPATLSFTPGSPVPSQDTATARVGDNLFISYGALLSVQQGAQTRDCNFRINIIEPDDPDTLFDIRFAPKAIDSTASSNAKIKVSSSYPLKSGDPATTMTVIVRPKSGSLNKKLRFTARLQCVADAAIFAETAETPITVTQS